MKKQEQHWHITRQQVRDTQQTNAWLAKQHICADRLADTDEVGVADSDAVADADGLALALADAVSDTDGEADADAVA